MKKETKWKRNCPNCKRILCYSRLSSVFRANELNSRCSYCAQSNENHPNYGKKLSEKTKEKIRLSLLGIKHTKERIEKNRKSRIGIKQSPESIKKRIKFRKGMKDSDETKRKRNNSLRRYYSNPENRRKARLSAIKRIQDKHGIIFPNYNVLACKIIDEYGNKNGYKFQHAMNDGEYYISELGYWVDGIDHNKKTIIEYYEKDHNIQKHIKRDNRRINEIKENTNYKIIIVREWTDKIEVI